MIKTIFNILAICGAAGFAGVMLCIGVTLGGYWRSLPPKGFLEWFAANNHFVPNTIRLIVPPTLIGMIGSLWTSWNTPTFFLWGLSFLCIVIVLALTVVYFLPTNATFASNGIHVSLVTNKLNQWLSLHNARICLAMIAAILGCVAMRG